MTLRCVARPDPWALIIAVDRASSAPAVFSLISVSVENHLTCLSPHAGVNDLRIDPAARVVAGDVLSVRSGVELRAKNQFIIFKQAREESDSCSVITVPYTRISFVTPPDVVVTRSIVQELWRGKQLVAHGEVACAGIDAATMKLAPCPADLAQRLTTPLAQ